MKSILIILGIILMNHVSYAQKGNIEYNLGYGVYNLNELKEFQNGLIENYNGIPLKNVTSFPNNIYNSILIDYKLQRIGYLGICGSIMSTGARNHLKDYSGEIKTDMLLTAYKIGISWRFFIDSIDRFSFFLSISSGKIFTKFEMNEDLVLNSINNRQSTKNSYNSQGLYFEPAISTRYALNKNFTINIKLAYQFYPKSNITSTEYNYSDWEFTPIKDNNGDDVLLNWSSFLSSIGVSYNF